VNTKRSSSSSEKQSRLEARARAAVLATAEEISPQDVPPPFFPLNGPVFSPERQVPRFRVRHATRPWLVPVAAAAAVVIVAGVTAGLAATRGSNGRTVNAAPAAQAAPAASAAKTAAPDQAPNTGTGLVWYQDPADWTQFSAGVAFWNATVGGAENKAFEQCLTRSGVKGGYTLPAAVPNPYAIPAPETTFLYPDLAVISAQGTLYPTGPGLADGISSTPVPEFTGSTSNVKAGTGCYYAALNEFSTVVNTLNKDDKPFITDLTNAVNRAVTASFKTAIPQLRACATKYGWPGTQTLNFQNFESWADGKVAKTDTGPLTVVDGQITAKKPPVTPATIALNKRWASIFVQCATPYEATTGNAAVAAQKQFLAVPANQKQMQAMAATFAGTLDKVEATLAEAQQTRG
jgi:hypothetical protein